MGIDLTCGNKEFSCSYYNWNNLREDAIRTSAEYMHNSGYKKLINAYDVNYIGNLTIDDINILRNLGLGGLHTLCAQFDCEGYYTPGNSMDICILFDILYHKNTRSKHLQELYDIFEYSWTNKELVIIS